jgi:S1-C subfamily serine protease
LQADFVFEKVCGMENLGAKIKLISVFMTIFFLGACNTTAPMKLETSVKSASFTDIAPDEKSSTFALTKLIIDIDRDEPIFAFPSKTIVESAYCNYAAGNDATVTYSGGKQYLGDWSSELGEVFHETWTRLGYNVAGDPDDIFMQSSAVTSAEYLVGGRLIKSAGNICHLHHWWDGRPLYTFGGEMSLTIEWSVMNTLTKSVIIKERIVGSSLLKQPTKGGITQLFEDAFADSADSFARSGKVRKVATGEQIEQGDMSSQLASIKVVQGEENNIFDINFLGQSVATVRVGMGHGSGFFVGEEGYLVTNQHVVGEASKVQIITASGIEVEGEVLYRNKMRDVALVKTPVRTPNALHLRLEPPKIATEVFAVGTPIDESLSSTVTKGIVSAIRKDTASGQTFIQADAAISPGNSGGPLFDSFGSVVGVSVAKFSGNSAEGLGLFIPLADAFSALGLVIE